jgi:hypothetical protein
MISGVIFLDDFFVGESEYESGEYRNQTSKLNGKMSGEYEDIQDTRRRYETYFPLIAKKTFVILAADREASCSKLRRLRQAYVGSSCSKVTSRC